MSHARAAGILIAIVMIAAAFIGAVNAFGVTEYWIGFLFLLSWAILEKMQVARLPAAILGSAAGALLAYLTLLLTPNFGAVTASAASLILILLAIYAILVGWTPTLINANFMLFLNVMSVPHIQGNVVPLDVATGLAAGVIFFSGLAVLIDWITKVRKRREPFKA